MARTTRMTARHGAHWVTVSEARELLGVGKNRIARMFHDHQLVAHPSPLDRRVKLIARADVERLLRLTDQQDEQDQQVTSSAEEQAGNATAAT